MQSGFTPHHPTRRRTKARRVLLQKMWSARPPVPEPCDLAFLFDGNDVPKHRSSACLFPLPPAGEAASLTWEAAESGKETQCLIEDADASFRSRVSGKFIEWLHPFECSFVEGRSSQRAPRAHRHHPHPPSSSGHGPRAITDTVFSDFCTEVLDACSCFTQRVEDLQAPPPAASPPPHTPPPPGGRGSASTGAESDAAAANAPHPEASSVLEEPENASFGIHQEVNLAVSCALLERCIGRAGALAPVMSRLFSAVIGHVYSGAEAPTQGAFTVASRVSHLLSRTPHEKAKESLSWENHALSEELDRSEKTLRLWAWVIWRNVIKGMRKVGCLLSGVEAMTETKRRRQQMRGALGRWRIYVLLEREAAKRGSVLQQLAPFSSAFTTEGRLADLLEMHEERVKEVHSLAKQLEACCAEAAQLREDLASVSEKSVANEDRALEALRRHTKAVNKVGELQADNAGLKTAMARMKEELASLRTATRSKRGRFTPESNSLKVPQGS